MPKIPTSPLDNVKVSSPCKTTWEAMTGDDRVRYCDKCRLNVYNLSGMTKPQAEKLISSTEGRLCVAFYRREDGSILTQNCPVGLAAIKQKVANRISLVLSLVVTFLTAVGLSSLLPKRESAVNSVPASNCISTSPSKSKSLPVLEQNSKESISPTGQISCYSQVDEADRKANEQVKQGPDVGELESTIYVETTVSPFSSEANKKLPPNTRIAKKNRWNSEP